MLARNPSATPIDKPPTSTSHRIPNTSSVAPSLATEIIGAELVDELQMQAPITTRSKASKTGVEDSFADHLTKAELETVRKYIAQTTRPSWHRGPPDNIGSPGAGKLKADQWRSCIEFDLVVAVARLYAPSTSKNLSPLATQRRTKLLKATIDLALAVRWGTSTITSTTHAGKYGNYMHSYLAVLLELYPERQLLPNQHAALHFPQFLLQFGPSPGWWMFPYERLIGRLQAINTNNKMGKRSLITVPVFKHLYRSVGKYYDAIILCWNQSQSIPLSRRLCPNT